MRSPQHRLRTLAVALPLWIVMILTGGQWCLMPEGGAPHPVVSSAAGMGHAGEAVLGAHGTHAMAEPHSRHSQHSQHSQHGRSGGDGASCESQAPCSVAIAAVAAPLVGAPVPHRTAPRPWLPGEPPSFALAPELPPPRA